MRDNATALIGMRVYTPKGTLLGEVSNLVLNLKEKRIDGLFLDYTNSDLVENSMAVNIPYRWVQAMDDVIILRTFPEWVSADSRKSAL